MASWGGGAYALFVFEYAKAEIQDLQVINKAGLIKQHHQVSFGMRDFQEPCPVTMWHDRQIGMGCIPYDSSFWHASSSLHSGNLRIRIIKGTTLWSCNTALGWIIAARKISLYT